MTLRWKIRVLQTKLKLDENELITYYYLSYIRLFEEGEDHRVLWYPVLQFITMISRFNIGIAGATIKLYLIDPAFAPLTSVKKLSKYIASYYLRLRIYSLFNDIVILQLIRNCGVISAAINYSTSAFGAMSLKSCRNSATNSKSEAAIVKDRRRL